MKHSLHMTQQAIGDKLCRSRQWVQQSLQRTKQRDLDTAVIPQRNYREDQLTKYNKAEKDIQRLLTEIMGRLFPDAKGPRGFPIRHDMHNLLELSDAFGRMMDRLLKLLNQRDTLLGLKTLRLDTTSDIGPNTRAVLERCLGGNGSRPGAVKELREIAERGLVN